MISAQDVKNLRERTGASMMDCKKALVEAKGDETKAIEILRKMGQGIAQKKIQRIAKEGVVAAYIHSNNKLGVLLELKCETDFVAKNETFRKLAQDLAMQVAAQNPIYLKSSDVSEDFLEKEREIYIEQFKELKKPQKIIDETVKGKIEKYFEGACLLNQKFIKDPNKTVKGLLQEHIALLGENIEIEGSLILRELHFQEMS